MVSLLVGRTAIKEMLPMQPGDVPATYADIEDLARDVGFRSAITLKPVSYRNYRNLLPTQQVFSL